MANQCKMARVISAEEILDRTPSGMRRDPRFRLGMIRAQLFAASGIPGRHISD